MVARDQQISLWKASQSLLDNSLKARAKTSVQGFVDLIENLTDALHEQDLEQQFVKTISLSGLQQHFEKDKSEQGQGRLENLDELISAAAQFDNRAKQQQANGINSEQSVMDADDKAAQYDGTINLEQPEENT
ncbi:hypothetical protein THIOSC13_1350085 [uncultured Thiomicrorhabdus sp.]